MENRKKDTLFRFNLYGGAINKEKYTRKIKP